MTAHPDAHSDGPRIGIRAMAEQDIDAVSALRLAGWRYAYAGLMPQAHLDAMDAREDAARQRARFADAASASTDLVAEDADGAVVGWACFGCGPATEHTDGAGELYALYARPDLIGTGIGRALMAEVLRRTGSWPALRLWVVEGNARARRFYERAGFTPDGAVSSSDVDGVPVPEVRYHRPAGRTP
ncbi:GNAT family N-acetyltransferase [Streptomyces sp. NPDC058674]|uniref:GNAT family N-acetyltransferase n=1 Tax=Streptomyces sp. NPDC058674 TaxID=3346592 RepID=UPI003669C964